MIGMLGVFLFMALYYRVFGLVADLVLLANVVLLTALLSMMGAALSLPGIAGIILTVGMAVDANVLIYERIREELRNGVSPQAAIRAGFEKAFSAILDSNVTTIIAGVVLWVFGTGPIRGFAVVLTLGIFTSMFTALMGSRALLSLMYGGKRKVARPSDRLGARAVEFFHKATNFPFMGTRKIWYALSVVLVLGSFLSFFTKGPESRHRLHGWRERRSHLPGQCGRGRSAQRARSARGSTSRRCRPSAPRATSRSACAPQKGKRGDVIRAPHRCRAEGGRSAARRSSGSKWWARRWATS